MNLVASKAPEMPAQFSNKEPDTEAMEADVLSLSIDELQLKYKIDDWVVLAKKLKLKGNHSKTGEEKLITKIKNELSS